MIRRALLRAMPAALAVAASPSAALCVADPAETPIMKLFREWESLFKIEQAVHKASATGVDAETMAATANLTALHDEVVSTPCKCARDWMMEAAAVSCFGLCPDELFWTSPGFVPVGCSC